MEISISLEAVEAALALGLDDLCDLSGSEFDLADVIDPFEGAGFASPIGDVGEAAGGDGDGGGGGDVADFEFGEDVPPPPDPFEGHGGGVEGDEGKRVRGRGRGRHGRGGAGGAGGGRPGGPASIKCDLGMGYITYYFNTAVFEATCTHPDHISPDGAYLCRRTRTARASTHVARAGQGRPIGLLAAWLLECPDDSYWHAHLYFLDTLTLEMRQHAREQVSITPGGDALLAMERAQRDGEGPEPDSVP